MSAAAEIARSLSAFPERGAGTDAERRAAVWVAEEIRRPGRREAELETFWSRPNWAMAQMWHAGLGLAGSLVSVASPEVGAGLLGAALICVLSDATFGISPGRRLTPERASQNVVSPPPPRPASQAQPDLRLIITANLDMARHGLARRTSVARRFTKLREAAAVRAPGWAGWLAIALLWALVAALLRAAGTGGTADRVAQLIPTVGLLIAVVLLLELAGAEWGPSGDNASGVGVAIALTRALDASPPAHAAVELVLSGAASGQSLGFRRYLRRHRDRRAANTIVLGIGPCATGAPAWLRSDGPLVPLAYSKVLRRLCAELAASDPSLGLSERRGRGSCPALAARQSGLPAITLTAADAETPEPAEHAMERMLLAGLGLADAIDAYLAGVRPA